MRQFILLLAALASLHLTASENQKKQKDELTSRFRLAR